MIKSSDSFGVERLGAPRLSTWETRKVAVVVHGIHVSLKTQRSALGSTDALVALSGGEERRSHDARSLEPRPRSAVAAGQA